jgi:hypothetical protein
MFSVSEAPAAIIRAAFEQRGELSAVVELRRLFPGVGNIAWARECVRTIAGWQPLHSRQSCRDRPCAGSVQLCPSPDAAGLPDGYRRNSPCWSKPRQRAMNGHTRSSSTATACTRGLIAGTCGC